MFSTSEATNTQFSALCPQGFECGLVVTAHRLKITGKKYSVNEGSNMVHKCPPSDKPTTKFEVVCFTFSHFSSFYCA